MSRTPTPKRAWFLYWLICFGVLAFGVPEAVAIVDPEPGDTLSESVRWVATHPVGTVGFLAFMGWFTWHILWQRPRRRPTQEDDPHGT